MKDNKKILIIEDDVEISKLISERLVEEEFEPFIASDGVLGLELSRKLHPSLILLDLTLPKIRGMEICRRLKEDPETKNIPIIVVTANSEEVDVIVGLEMGADDYVIKPFSLRQLVARIRAVLRRSASPQVSKLDEPIVVGPLFIDRLGREVKNNRNSVPLTPTEFEFLELLASKAGQVVTRNEMLRLITGEDETLVDRNVDVHVGSLRRKLGEAGKVIVTVRSLGYKCLANDQIEL